MSERLELRGMSKRYGLLLALDNLTLDVRPGELLAVLGPSGCGKSTLLKVVAGLLEPTVGEVYLGGRRIDGLKPQVRGIGFLFQNYALFPQMTVAQNVGFGLMVQGVAKSERGRRVKELLELVGLDWAGGKLPRQLSGGEQQRVALARALAPRPAVLLLDEPLSALDVQIRQKLRRELKELQKRVGVTTVIVTHDQQEAFELGDRIAVMRRGRLEQLGTPREVYEEPASEFVARFVGTVNVLEWPDGAGLRPEDEVLAKTWGRGKVLVRPEDIQVLGCLGEGSGGIAGRIKTVLYLGSHLQLTVDLPDGQVVTAMVGKETGQLLGLAPGESVLLRLGKFRVLSSEECRSA